MIRPSLKTIIEFIAALSILAGGVAWWVRFDREVQARLTRDQVEHVVTYMVDDRVNAFSSTFAEILRRLERIERQSDRNTEILLEDRQRLRRR